MCTLTIWRRSDVLHVVMNRDELHGRPPTRGLHQTSEAAWPVDGGAGGTWIGANAQGLVLALLNHYPPHPPPRPPGPSRGRLIPALLAQPGPHDVLAALRATSLETTAPFQLVAVAPGHTARVATWDAHHLTERALDPGFLSSSSLRTAEIRTHRRRLFDEFVSNGLPDLPSVRAWHARPDPEDPARGIHMHRSDAATRSLTEIEVSPDHVRLTHLDRPPGAAWPAPDDPALWSWRGRRQR